MVFAGVVRPVVAARAQQLVWVEGPTKGFVYTEPSMRTNASHSTHCSSSCLSLLSLPAWENPQIARALCSCLHVANPAVRFSLRFAQRHWMILSRTLST